MSNQKICLITGASSGLGKEIALSLALSGYHVIIVCRDKNKGQQIQHQLQTKSQNKNIDLLIADLSSQADIHGLAKTIYENYPRVDVLINNAGVVVTQKTLTIDGIETTLATNYIAPFLLTNLLLNLMRNSTNAHILNISSASHKWVKLNLNDLQYNKRKYRTMSSYAQSKLLINFFTFTLANKLKDTSITVNALHPGAVNTALGSQNKVNFALSFIDKLLKLFFMSPRDAAKAPVDFIRLADNNKITGKYFEKNKERKASQQCYDVALQEKLWKLTETFLL